MATFQHSWSAVSLWWNCRRRSSIPSSSASDDRSGRCILDSMSIPLKRLVLSSWWTSQEYLSLPLTMATAQSSYSCARQTLVIFFLRRKCEISSSTPRGRVFDGSRACCIREKTSSTWTLHSKATGFTASPEHVPSSGSAIDETGVEKCKTLPFWKYCLFSAAYSSSQEASETFGFYSNPARFWSEVSRCSGLTL